MSGSLAEMFVSLRPDGKKFQPEADRIIRRTNVDRAGRSLGINLSKSIGGGMRVGLGGALKSAFGPVAALAGGLGLASFFKDAVGGASDLNETLSKSAAVFGPANKEILRFASTSAKSLGQSKQEASAAAAQFGNMFNQLGIGQKPAADMSIQMVKLASDFASFHNADISDVLEAQQAAFRGEFDAVQKFVPTINAAAVEQEGLRLKLAGSSKELTAQDKALATQSLLMKGAGKATGDFSRTSGGLANQQRILSAGFADFKASIGAVALPLATKFFTFLNTSALPGVRALFSAFQEGDVTSDGFVGFMERVGVSARSAFGFFKSEVLPRLKEFSGFVTGTVIPALGGMASFVKRNKDFFVPLAGTIVGIVAALKTWAVVQGILNVVLAANPIGLVVIAIAALVGGLVYAYKHSDQFRKVADTAFKVVAASGKFMWEAILKPLLGFMAATFKFVWERAQFWAKVVVAAFNALKGPAVTVFRFLVGKMLDFIGNMLSAAAKAFGWVPKLGGPLKNAATEFQKFRTSVNKSLDQINDEPVDIKVGLAYTQALGQRTKQMKFARGGMMPGYTPGRDVHRFFSATGGILDLSGGEPVLRPEAGAVLGKGWVDGVNGAARNGGQGGVRRFLGGFASGGLLPRALLPSGKRLSALASTVSGSVDTVATRVAQAIAKQLVAGRVNPGLSGALGFARSQVGKPYVWGGVGPGGYDCSGFMSAITNAVLGRPLHRRLFATGSFPTSMFARGMGAFSIGSFRGNPGHMAGTLNGVNVESRGGRGVVVGNGARGAQNSLFGGNVWHLKRFKRGGVIGDLPYDLLKNRRDLREELGLQVFDQGGSWRSGTLGINTSGKTETVIPDAGAVRLDDATLRALEKLFARVFSGGLKLRMDGQGNAYLLTNSIG